MCAWLIFSSILNISSTFFFENKIYIYKCIHINIHVCIIPSFISVAFIHSLSCWYFYILDFTNILYIIHTCLGFILRAFSANGLLNWHTCIIFQMFLLEKMETSFILRESEVYFHLFTSNITIISLMIAHIIGRICSDMSSFSNTQLLLKYLDITLHTFDHKKIRTS